MNRYKLARARSPERYQQLLREDADLLAHFGMTLTAVESGLSMVPTRVVKSKKRINPWDVVNVNMTLWEWMRPLLDELRSRRLEGSLASGNGRVDHVNVSELAAK